MVLHGTLLLLMMTGLLSSALISQLGIHLLVQAVFLGSIGFILLKGLLHLPHRVQTKASVIEKSLAVAGLLLALSAVGIDISEGRLIPDSYKFMVLFGLMFVSYEISRHVNPERILRHYWGLLGLYTVLVFAAFLVGVSDSMYSFAGGDAPMRMAVTGSVTQQGILCITSILLSIPLLTRARRLAARVAILTLILLALCIVMLSASRQVILIAALTLMLVFVSQSWTSRRAMTFRLKLIGVALMALVLFFAFSFLVDDTLYRRVFDNPQEAYATGRVAAITNWLAEKDRAGQALGFGHIGRNINYETEHLWPHNEFVRFYIEGGWLGVGIMLIFFGYQWLCLSAILRAPAAGAIKSLGIICVAILTVQMLLDNVVHTIFRIGFYFFFLGVAAHFARQQAQTLRQAYSP